MKFNSLDIAKLMFNGSQASNALINGQSVLVTSVSIVNSGLVLWFSGADFTNSPQTSTLTDKSGNGNNATASGFAYTSASGSNGTGGIVIDGVDDKLTVSNALNLTTWTMQFKVNIGIQTTYGRMFSDGETNYFYADNSVHRIKTTGSSSYTNFTYVDNTTYDICQVYDGTNHKLYVNGVLNTSMVKSVSAITSAMFGNRAANDRGFKGTFYNILMYNRALNDAEILQNYNAMA